MPEPAIRGRRVAAMLSTLSLAWGCATTGTPANDGYEFFAGAGSGDVWFEKVEEWQARERIHQGVPEPRHEGPLSQRSSLLRVKFKAFEIEEKRALARRFMSWSQDQARLHYRFDERQDLAGDHWPTTKELFDNNGDDCDGLDLIAYNLMRQLGFHEREIFRAVIRRDRDRENHMVTFWFEDPDDPWVIDVTGAMTMRMRRLSELPGWTPTVIFNEHEHYTVRRRAPRVALD
jgi:hypothetical protein